VVAAPATWLLLRLRGGFVIPVGASMVVQQRFPAKTGT